MSAEPGADSRLFADVERRYEGPADYAEPQYFYLDRSARTEAAKVRELLEAWFSHYPDGHRTDLLSRLQSCDDGSFLSAFLELYLHELCRKLDCGVTIHPEIPGTEKSPDFLVSQPGGESFYLEATLARAAVESPSASRRANTLFDALNRVDSPNFFLDVRYRGVPRTQPSGHAITARLEPWLAGLNPDALLALYAERGFAGLPSKEFDLDGCRLTFRPIPKSPWARERLWVRPLGARWHPASRTDARKAILRELRKKATRYGDLNLAYVVAMNVRTDSVPVHADDFADALFGRLGVTRLDGEERWTRDRDGLWMGPQGRRNTRVSAVLGFSNMTPWDVRRRDARLYHNPWTRRPYSGVLERLTSGRVGHGWLGFRPGVHPGSVLDLPDGFPE